MKEKTGGNEQRDGSRSSRKLVAEIVGEFLQRFRKRSQSEGIIRSEEADQFESRRGRPRRKREEDYSPGCLYVERKKLDKVEISGMSEVSGPSKTNLKLTISRHLGVVDESDVVSTPGGSNESRVSLVVPVEP